MAKFKKLLAKMRNNPHDWRIEDLKTIADKLYLQYRQPGQPCNIQIPKWQYDYNTGT